MCGLFNRLTSCRRSCGPLHPGNTPPETENGGRPGRVSTTCRQIDSSSAVLGVLESSIPPSPFALSHETPSDSAHIAQQFDGDRGVWEPFRSASTASDVRECSSLVSLPLGAVSSIALHSGWLTVCSFTFSQLVACSPQNGDGRQEAF